MTLTDKEKLEDLASKYWIYDSCNNMNAKRKPNPRIIVNFTSNPGCFDGSLEGIVM